MVKNQRLLAIYKLCFGVLGLTAIMTEIAVLVERGRFMPANFFSFFTIESNLLAAIVFVTGGLSLIYTGHQVRVVTILRGAATLYMLITGIVFAVLLSGLEIQLTAVPWDNIVLHYIIPVAIVIDWILDPPLKRIDRATVLLWLVFPLTYLGYSLVRGHIINWYPYPFLNPATNGYGGVAVVSVGILALALVLAWLLTQASGRKTSHRG